VKENALKEQRKAETITIETQLFMFAAGTATAKRSVYFVVLIGMTLFMTCNIRYKFLLSSRRCLQQINADGRLERDSRMLWQNVLASPVPKLHILYLCKVSCRHTSYCEDGPLEFPGLISSLVSCQGGTKAHSFDELKVCNGQLGHVERLKQSGHLTKRMLKNNARS